MAKKKAAVKVMGVDVGGSGIKGGIVDLRIGELITERHRIKTPKPATPKAVAGVVSELVDHFSWKGQVGVAIPTIVRRGFVHSAANIDKSWVGENAEKRFSKALSRPVRVLNDADAAGLAELHYGTAAEYATDGVAILLTFGTGIGSAIFVDGQLLPNSELGHLQLQGDDAEHWASAKAREDEKLSWKAWAARVTKYLAHLEFLFSPDVFIIGGGVSRQSADFFPYLKSSARIIAAELENRAGVVGAAWYAAQEGAL
ncbi:MAG: ROK family protein [Acidimicrobiia bacterium]|nr:ROK family protein [Acidimicrobiia bacterium]